MVNPNSYLPPQSQPWGRSVDQRITDLQKLVERNQTGSDNTLRQLASSVNLLSGQVAEQQQIVADQQQIVTDLQQVVTDLPVPVGYFAESYGFGLDSGPVYIQQTITIPADKTRVVFTAVGNVAVVDTLTGGIAVADAYIEVNGAGFVWSSPVVPASKDAGASAVNNIIAPVLGFEQAGLVPGETFLLSMTINATNPSAFPPSVGNFGTVAMSGIFFN